MNSLLATKFHGEAVIAKVRRLAVRRGGENGIRGLSRALRITDDDGNLLLTTQEFTAGLLDYGVVLSTEELQAVWAYFDRNGAGRITATEFIAALRGGLNPVRRSLVQRTFDLFDHDSNGSVTVDDLRSRYDVSRHPLVVRGEASREDVLRKFLDSFDQETNPDGVITLQEFEQYYAGVSASIDSDEFFSGMMRACWALPGSNPVKTAALTMEAVTSFQPAATKKGTLGGSSNKSPVVATKAVQTITLKIEPLTHAKGSSIVLGSQVTSDPKQRIPNSLSATSVSESTTLKKSFCALQHVADKENLAAEMKLRFEFDKLVKVHRDTLLLSIGTGPKAKATARQCSIVANEGAAPSIGLGFRGVGRLLRLQDPDHIGYISSEAFLECLWKNRLYVDNTTLLQCLNTNGDGTVDYIVYLNSVVGQLPPSRRLLVERLWKSMPTDKNNRTDISTLRQRFRAPDGITLNWFSNGWDSNFVHRDGRVSLIELEEWLMPQSVEVTMDSDFDKLMNLQWILK